MSIRFFSLDGINDDDADDIREVLRTNNIEFYETPHGNWGFSMAALWLPDESQFLEAKEVLNTYLKEKHNDIYQNFLTENANRTTLQKILHNPKVVALYLPTLFIVFLTIFLLYIR